MYQLIFGSFLHDTMCSLIFIYFHMLKFIYHSKSSAIFLLGVLEESDHLK
jgi:hypothetical protein